MSTLDGLCVLSCEIPVIHATFREFIGIYASFYGIYAAHGRLTPDPPIPWYFGRGMGQICHYRAFLNDQWAEHPPNPNTRDHNPCLPRPNSTPRTRGRIPSLPQRSRPQMPSRSDLIQKTILAVLDVLARISVGFRAQ